MKAEELLHRLLEIEPPFQIVRIREDFGKQQIDVWIGQQTGKSNWLFGAKTATVSGDKEHVWRHMNLGNSRCIIHAEASSNGPKAPWQGEVGQPFTRAMAHLIAGMMKDGIRLQSICAILDVSVGDLWKYRHSLDSGVTGLTTPLPASVTDDGTPASAVPDLDAPVWSRILDGTATIEIRLLSLKLLLARMKEQMRTIKDPEVRVLKCYELQRFFVRHEKMLSHELAELKKLG